MQKLTRKKIIAIAQKAIEKYPNRIGWYIAIENENGNFAYGKKLIASFKNAKRKFKKDRFFFVKLGIDC